MRIETVRIQNFRALHDVTVAFDAVTTFVGPNGAGKSTILNALDWFFNGPKGSLSSDLDCTTGYDDDPIRVEVSFADLTPRDREVLGGYVTRGDSTFRVWKTRGADGVESISANVLQYPAFSAVRTETSASGKRTAYQTLRTENPGLELPAVSRADDIESEFRSWELKNPTELRPAAEVLTTNLFGFNGQAVMSGLFDFVYVKADYRAADETQDAKATILGRILEKTIDRTLADTSIERIVEDARKLQQDAYEEAFGDRLKVINTSLSDQIKVFAKGRSVEVQAAEVSLKAPRTSFEMRVVDGETRTSVDRQGHGFQRTMLIGALQLLAQSTDPADQGTICLAIEEPELFQHPLQAKSFAKILRDLGERASGDVQVVYATHSPHFVEIRHFDQVRRVTRGANGKAQVSSTTKMAITSSLAGLIEEDKIDRQLDAMIANRLSSAIFAERVVLVEGPTDVAVIQGLADRRSPASLETRGVEVVAVGGKTALVLPAAVLEALGIDVFILFDADAGLEERLTNRGDSVRRIQECVSENERHNRLVQQYRGISPIDLPPESFGGDIGNFADTLEGTLSEWTAWTQLRDEMTEQWGQDLQKNAEAYRMVTSRVVGNPPDGLRELDAAIDSFASGS